VLAAWMLQGACVGKEAGAQNIAFFRVKWLQPAMKGSWCVRRLRAGFGQGSEQSALQWSADRFSQFWRWRFSF